jgi:uncharacterized membrane protein
MDHLLLADRAVEIVADRGVHTRVGAREWETICGRMETAFKRANYGGGVVDGIQAATQRLIKQFPLPVRVGMSCRISRGCCRLTDQILKIS